MNASIETRGLSKRYGKEAALTDLSFEVPEGAVYALVGANGAGKSTLIKLLMNIVGPTAGEGTVLGEPLTKVEGRLFERIGYMSENQELPESMAVRGFLKYLRGFYPAWDTALETQLVRGFDLPMNRKLKQLSRGMKMKAALASVLAYRPELIVLDEPFSGLDPLVRDEFIGSLMERVGKTTILVSTHDLSEIENFATHVGYLEQGRLLFSEDRAAMSARFREMEVLLPYAPTDPAAARMAASADGSWLQPKVEGTALRFVHSAFGENSEAEVREKFPDALAVTATAMTLRAMFLAIAKSGRSKSAEAGAAR